MIRLRYIIESCQSLQTVLFSGLRNILLQILRLVGRVWNEDSRMLCQRLASPSTTTKRLVLQNLPSLGLPALIRPPPIWRVLNKLRCERLQNNEALQSAQYYRPKASYELYSAIYNAVAFILQIHIDYRNTKACSELVVLEVRVRFSCPHTYTPRSNSAKIALSNINVRFTLEHFPSH